MLVSDQRVLWTYAKGHKDLILDIPFRDVVAFLGSEGEGGFVLEAAEKRYGDVAAGETTLALFRLKDLGSAVEIVRFIGARIPTTASELIPDVEGTGRHRSHSSLEDSSAASSVSPTPESGPPGSVLPPPPSAHASKASPAAVELGRVLIISPWQYAATSYPPGGPPQGFVASRWFAYEIAGPLGSAMTMTHHQYCDHIHPTEREARPCLDDLRARGGQPSIADLGPRLPPRMGRGLSGPGAGDGVSATVSLHERGVQFGGSGINWSGIEKVVWHGRGVQFWLKPGLSADSAAGSPMPVNLIDVEDLGEASASWSEFIANLGLDPGTERV